MEAIQPFGAVTVGRASPLAGGNRYSILEKLLAAALADQMLYMGGLIGQSRAECPVGEGAGAKGLPEGLARVFGHDVLTVIARDQHHYMAGALAALVAAVDLALRLLFTLFLLFTLGCHDALAPALDGAPIIFLSAWLSYPHVVLVH